MNVVSISILIRTSLKCSVVNYLRGRGKMSMANRKGKGKRMVNNLEETVRGTRSQTKALCESWIFELGFPMEI